MLNSVIVDDEPLARQELRDQLEQAGNFTILAEFNNAIECLTDIHKLKADVLFVDIHMPKISGLEMVNMLDEDDRPFIVFVTAYDEYAIQAFEDNAFDYLLKPIEPARLQKTLTRLTHQISQTASQPIPAQPLTLIPCYQQNKVRLVQLNEVCYAFSDLSGVHIGTNGGEYHTQLTLSVLEEKTDLVRCHRQYLVQPQVISEIELLDNGSAKLSIKSGKSLPVSRRYLKELKALFGI
jgi:two-component system LytT family response regulator